MTDERKAVQAAPDSADSSRRAFVKKAGIAAAAAPAATLLLSSKQAKAIIDVSGIIDRGER